MSIKLGSKIVSQLGSTESRLPLAVKDVFNSGGYTYQSYKAGGNIEAKDRFVDEVGTGAIWLGGIPVFRKLVDLTLFKAAKISPNVDYRVIKDKDYYKKALENAPTKEIAEELKTASENLSKTRNLNIAKFAISIGLTMLSYFALTKAKQGMTKKNIEKEFLKKQKNEVLNNQENEVANQKNKSKDVFDDIIPKDKSKITFGSVHPAITVAEEFVLNPMKNMIILDSLFSGERIANSRTSGERKEYAIKEGSFLFFVYGADKLIKKGINEFSKKVLKAPIELESDFLSSDLARKVLTNKKTQKNIKTFIEDFSKNTNSNELYDFIFKNPKNIVVQAGIKSGIIPTLKDGSIDTRKYIDTKQIQKLAKNLDDFVNMKNQNENFSKYISKIKNLKVGSTIANIATCCIALGIITPKIIYKLREREQNGNKSFHVAEAYEKELQAKNLKKD